MLSNNGVWVNTRMMQMGANEYKINGNGSSAANACSHPSTALSNGQE